MIPLRAVRPVFAVARLLRPLIEVQNAQLPGVKAGLRQGLQAKATRIPQRTLATQSSPRGDNCPGCGAKFQHTDRNRAGYLPPHVAPTRVSVHARIAEQFSLSSNADTINPSELKRLLRTRKMAKKLGRDEEDEGRPICRRCKTILTTPEETSRKFPDPTKAFAELRTAPSAVVICVADVLDLPGSLVTDLKKLTGDKPSILVVGKIDAMPEGWDRSAVRDYVDELASSLGIDEAVLVSAATSEGIKDLSVAVNELLSAARKRGENPSIYLVGRSNVGKSRLLNALIDFAVRRRNGGPFDALVTDSPLPGTTINSIRAPLTNFGTLFDTPDPPPAGNPPAEFVDTPGLPNPGNLLNLLTLPECRAVHPRSSLPSRAYVVDSGRSLFVSGLARIDCLEGMAEAAVFVSKGVDTHRTPTEKAGNFYERHVGTMLTPPVVTEENREERLKLLPPLKKALEVELTGSRHDSTDLVLSGLGWVNLRSRKGAKLEVWTSGGAGAATRRGWDAEVKEVVLPSGRRKSKD